MYDHSNDAINNSRAKDANALFIVNDNRRASEISGIVSTGYKTIQPEKNHYLGANIELTRPRLCITVDCKLIEISGALSMTAISVM